MVILFLKGGVGCTKVININGIYIFSVEEDITYIEKSLGEL